jgi:hypothetical protein
MENFKNRNETFSAPTNHLSSPEVKKRVKVMKSSPASYDVIVASYGTGKTALGKELPERPLASFTCLFPRRCT